MESGELKKVLELLDKWEQPGVGVGVGVATAPAPKLLAELSNLYLEACAGACNAANTVEDMMIFLNRCGHVQAILLALVVGAVAVIALAVAMVRRTPLRN